MSDKHYPTDKRYSTALHSVFRAYGIADMVQETDMYDSLCMEVDEACLNVEAATVRRLSDSRDRAIDKLSALQRYQTHMREPERTVVCDLIANGMLLPDPHGARYGHVWSGNVSHAAYAQMLDDEGETSEDLPDLRKAFEELGGMNTRTRRWIRWCEQHPAVSLLAVWLLANLLTCGLVVLLAWFTGRL